MTKIKKVFTVILVVMILLPQIVNATEIINSRNPNVQKAENYAVEFVKTMEKNTTLKAVKTVILKNINDNTPIAVCVTLNNGGYVICGINSLNVFEYAVEAGSNPYNHFLEDMYYGGPLQYYTLTNGRFHHLLSEEQYTQSALNIMCSDFYNEEATKSSFNLTENYEQKMNSLQMTNRSARLITSGELNGTLSTAWVSTASYCGPTAAYIVLKYMDKLRDDPLSATNEIKYIAEYTGADVDLSSLKSGIQRYISSYGKPGTVYTSSYSFSRVISCIDADKPLTLGTNGGGLSSGGHVQTIWGYQRENNYYVLKVNDGWGSNARRLTYDTDPPSYLKDHVYIA